MRRRDTRNVYIGTTYYMRVCVCMCKIACSPRRRYLGANSFNGDKCRRPIKAAKRLSNEFIKRVHIIRQYDITHA